METRLLHMPDARFITGTGDEVFVQLPGTELRPGAVHYDEAQHKGHLICRCCEAKVHFNKGAEDIAGSNLIGARPHFKRNPGSDSHKNEHADDCLLRLRLDEKRDPTEYNLNAGYKIHINGMLRPTFERHGGLYRRDGLGKIHAKDRDLEGREPFSVRKLDDVVSLIKFGEFNRLFKSVVIDGASKQNWNRFLVRYDQDRGHARFKSLVESLRDGKSRLCVMEIRPTDSSAAQADLFSRNTHIASQEIPYRVAIGKKPEFIVPSVKILGDGLAASLAGGGRLLVMGYPHLITHEQEDSIIHTLEIVADKPEMIMPADLRQLAGEGMERREKRIEARRRRDAAKSAPQPAVA